MFTLVNRGGKSFHQNIQASSGYQLNMRMKTDHRQVVHLPVYIVQPLYQHAQKRKMVRNTQFHMMTVEQTANWIWTFGVHMG